MLLKPKKHFFTPFNHVKEFMKFVHTEVLFSELFKVHDRETVFPKKFWVKSLLIGEKLYNLFGKPTILKVLFQRSICFKNCLKIEIRKKMVRISFYAFNLQYFYH